MAAPLLLKSTFPEQHLRQGVSFLTPSTFNNGQCRHGRLQLPHAAAAAYQGVLTLSQDREVHRGMKWLLNNTNKTLKHTSRAHNGKHAH
jgi:hypothetical protein